MPPISQPVCPPAWPQQPEWPPQQTCPPQQGPQLAQTLFGITALLVLMAGRGRERQPAYDCPPDAPPPQRPPIVVVRRPEPPDCDVPPLRPSRPARPPRVEVPPESPETPPSRPPKRPPARPPQRPPQRPPGRVYDDPVIQGFDGEKFKVHGTKGKTPYYNLITDDNLNVNAKFGKIGNSTGTWLLETGLQVGDQQIRWDAKSNAPVVVTDNNRVLNEGDTVDLGNGQTARFVNGQLQVNTQEYDFNLNRRYSDLRGGNFLNLDNVVLKGDDNANGILGVTAAPGRQVVTEEDAAARFNVQGLFDGIR